MLNDRELEGVIAIGVEHWRAGRLKTMGACFVDSERHGLWNDWRVGDYAGSEWSGMVRRLDNIWTARRRNRMVGHGAE